MGDEIQTHGQNGQLQVQKNQSYKYSGERIWLNSHLWEKKQRLHSIQVNCDDLLALLFLYRTKKIHDPGEIQSFLPYTCTCAVESGWKKIQPHWKSSLQVHDQIDPQCGYSQKDINAPGALVLFTASFSSFLKSLVSLPLSSFSADAHASEENLHRVPATMSTHPSASPPTSYRQ